VRGGVTVVVQLSSERTLEPVRKDCSFAEKQVSRPALLFLVRRGRLLSAGGDARTARETGCAPTQAGASAERATETRSRPLVTTVRWSRGTACESRLRVREVRAPAGEDVARVADVAGVERLVVPGDVGARVAVVRDERAP
jgi:hypothetical protein